MGFVWNCTALELAEYIAEEQGKDKSKVHKDSRGGFFTYDPLVPENTPSLSVVFDSDGGLGLHRFPEEKGNPEERLRLVTTMAIKGGLCSMTNREGQLIQSLDLLTKGTVQALKRDLTKTKQTIFKAGDTYKDTKKGNSYTVEKVFNYNLESGKVYYQRLRCSNGFIYFNRGAEVTKKDRILYNQDLLFKAQQAQEEDFESSPYVALPYPKESLLEEMQELKQWVFWKHQRAGDLKFPVDENRVALKNWSNPDLWHTYSELDDIQQLYTKKGFMFTDSDPFVLFDFDDALQEGEIPSHTKIDYRLEPITAQDIESYFVEISNSGRGYHLIIKLKDAKLKKKLISRAGDKTSEKVKESGFECYFKSGKWCALTLNEVDEFSLEVIEGKHKTQTVYITSKEEDADLLTSKGLLATSCGKAPSYERGGVWQEQFNTTLKDFNCIVLADRTALEETALGVTIAGSLYNSKHTAGLKLVTLEEGLQSYFSNHNLDDLLATVEGTPEYIPTKEEPLKIEDKIDLNVELKAFTFDITGNAQRVLDYTGGNIQWVWDGGEKVPFVYNSIKGAWVESYDDALALSQIALRKILLEISEKHKGMKDDELKQAIKWAKASQSPKAAKDALETTYSLNDSTLLPSDFDLHPKMNNGRCLINCKNGIVDLCTGELLEHTKEEHITQFCDREYHPEKTSPLWEKCLLDIFEGDQSLVDNFQLHIGYAAMGYPKEKAFFVFHGDAGDTGKSTVLETLKNVLGVDYAGEIPFNTIQINEFSDSSKPDSFLSKVKKAHIVTISETETKEGKRAALNFEKVKTLSGADSIPIRDLYKPATSFVPKFTLMIALNNKPRISDLKDSTWDRMRLFPFVHKFTGAEKDPDMGSKLLKEAEGIFSWIVQGAIKYTQLGELPKHPKVVEAVREYRAEENPLEVWLDDCAIIEKGAVELRVDLLESIERWFGEEDLEPPTKTKITQFLKTKGVNLNRKYKQVKGIQLTQREKLELENARIQEQGQEPIPEFN